jgi:hypothetical protein
VRYYLYISEAKLDILTPQLPWRYRRSLRPASRSWSLGARLPLVHASVSNAHEEAPALHKQLDSVERYLDQHGLLGGVDDGATWIRGELDMQWAAYGPKAVRGAWARPEDAVVFWRAEPERVILIGGSARHLVGPKVPASLHRSYGSSLPGLRRVLAETGLTVRSRLPGAQRKDAFDVTSLRWLAFDILDFVDEYRGAPIQRVQFLARRHTHDFDFVSPMLSTSQKITLATPLYVAASDDLR